MKNNKKVNGGIWMKFIVVVLMIALLFAIAIEYKTGSKLLDDNESLLNTFVSSELNKQLQTAIARLPSDSTELKAKWRKIPAEFTLIENGNRIYPLTLIALNKTENRLLWERYFETDDELYTSDGEISRAAILDSLRKAIEAGEQSSVVSLSTEFINHLRFYKLSSLEELISRLAFLDLSQSSRWNDRLTNSILLEGHQDFLPVLYYLFIDNSTMTAKDYERAFQLSKKVLELSPIDGGRFFELHQARSLAIQSDVESEGTYISTKTLFVNSENKRLALPFDFKEQVDSLQNSLIENGLFDNDDYIDFEQDLPINLALLELNVVKKTWQSSRQGLLYMSLVKIAFIVIFTFLVLVIVHKYEQKQKQKQQALSNKEQFIHFVGHELKTPVASIRLMSETLVKRQEAKLSAKDYAYRIVNEADKLNHMVDNLLSLQRLQQTQTQLQLESLSLFALIEQTIQQFSDEVLATIIFDNRVDPQLELKSEATLLGLVIKNLIDNAIKYRSQAQVKIQFVYDENKKQLLVIDNGIGISVNDPQKVFDTFFQDNHSKQGFGIGLNLCKTVMLKLQGDIRVKSTNSNGTTWQIDFERQKR